MLREVLASSAAKLVAACVCPVVGVTALTVSVPKVRSAVHGITAPSRPIAKIRPRTVVRAAPIRPGARIICPQLSGIGPILLPIGIDALPGVAMPRLSSDGGAIGGGANPREGRDFASLPNPSTGSGGNGSMAGPDDGEPVTVPGVTGVDTPEEAAADTTITRDAPAAIVPEPATWALVIIGFGLVGAAARRGARRRLLRSPVRQ